MFYGELDPEHFRTPAYVTRLRQRLLTAAGNPHTVIPHRLRSVLETNHLASEEFHVTLPPEKTWDTLDAYSNAQANRLKDHVLDLYRRFTSLHGDVAEDASWSRAVAGALEGVDSRNTGSGYVLKISASSPQRRQTNVITIYRSLKVSEISSYKLDEDYLPYSLTKEVLPLAKVDLGLLYPQSEFDRPPTTYLSPISGALGKRYVIAVPVEVKSEMGQLFKAEYQLAVFASAILELRYKWRPASKFKQGSRLEPEVIPVVPALCVHGHSWTFYLIYDDQDYAYPKGRRYTSTPRKKPEKKRIVYGPWPAGNTMTLLGTFKLVRFLSIFRQWLDEELLPVLQEELDISVSAYGQTFKLCKGHLRALPTRVPASVFGSTGAC